VSDLGAQLEDLRRDTPLVTLALGIAAAYALLDIAHGVAGFVEDLLTNQSSDGGLPIIELAVVVSAAVLVRRRSDYLPADRL
jgi:hypothetical protein